MTRDIFWLACVGWVGVMALPACGGTCGDDGWVWQQSDNAACRAAVSDSEASSGTSSGSSGDATTTPTSDPSTDATTTQGTGDASSTGDPTTEDPTTSGGGLWCADADGDGAGDPNTCQEQEFPGAVPNDGDCDDGDANTFPGAAENESTEACMTDADADGWGDNDPGPGVEPGTDCNDSNEHAYPGAAEKDSADACMQDADGDGYGDSNPGPGVEPGADCDDMGEHTFPGAAPNDDPDACMKDVDGDDWGDSSPPPNVTPGNDCDDADGLIFDCVLWCIDADADGGGDPGMCVGVKNGDQPPGGHVDNASDCADDNPGIYTGAAAQEPELCTLDADQDGWGDDSIKDTVPAAENGSDCLDSDANAFPGAAEIDDLAACMLDADQDGWGDLDPPEGVAAGRDCDDENMDRIICVDVNPSCAATNLGMGTQLTASAVGGDGNYSYSWDEIDTLNDPLIADPIATPTKITTYTVTATDGLGHMGTDAVTVHLNDKPWVLGGQGAECVAVGFLGAAAPHSFANGGTTTCTTGNSDPTAFVCPTVHENAKITGTMVVNPPVDDDDYIGFVWGWQSPDQYYMLHWKQFAQNIGGCNSAAGMTVKLVDRKNPYAAADFTCNTDTPNAKVLLTPAQTTTQGWVHGVQYGVVLLYAQNQTEITVTNLGNNAVVANFVVNDSTYPSGQFGTYDYSQIRACNGPWNSSCL